MQDSYLHDACEHAGTIRRQCSRLLDGLESEQKFLPAHRKWDSEGVMVYKMLYLRSATSHANKCVSTSSALNSCNFCKAKE
jgi:hypothetical protein